MPVPSAVLVPSATLVPSSYAVSSTIAGVMPLLEVSSSVASGTSGS